MNPGGIRTDLPPAPDNLDEDDRLRPAFVRSVLAAVEAGDTEGARELELLRRRARESLAGRFDLRVRLIGATTHNPGFYVNPPLLSRSHSRACNRRRAKRK